MRYKGFFKKDSQAERVRKKKRGEKRERDISQERKIGKWMQNKRMKEGTNNE